MKNAGDFSDLRKRSGGSVQPMSNPAWTLPFSA
jgi:hypothetical protein